MRFLFMSVALATAYSANAGDTPQSEAAGRSAVYQTVMEKIYWLDDDMSLEELSWFYKRQKVIVDKTEKQRFYEMLGAVLLMNGKGTTYRDYVSKKLANKADFESKTREACKKCGGNGNIPVNCKICDGKGGCPRSTCRNGITPGPFVMGRRLDIKCGGCKGTTRCAACEGTGTKDSVCFPCRGRGTVRSPDALKKVYKASRSALQQGLQVKVAERSIVAAAGPLSKGTGFLVRLGKKHYVATTAHLLNGNTPLTFRLASGKTVECGDIVISNDRDLALFEVKTPEKYTFLEVFAAAKGKNAKGKNASVFASGKDAITAVSGNVVEFGPRLVKTEIDFSVGNNGSPLLIGTQVAGLATSTTWTPPNWTRSGKTFDKVHHFVTRLDTVKSRELKALDSVLHASQARVLQGVHKDWKTVAKQYVENRQRTFTDPQTTVLSTCIATLDSQKEWALPQSAEEAAQWKVFLTAMVKELGVVHKPTAAEKEAEMWKELEKEEESKWKK